MTTLVVHDNTNNKNKEGREWVNGIILHDITTQDIDDMDYVDDVDEWGDI